MSDWKKRLDEAATGIGRNIRKAADGARKVAGIGVGEIVVGGSRRARRSGLYSGTITLKLTEPVEDSNLELILYAKRTRLAVERLRDGTASRETITVFKRVIEVSPNGTHESGTFPFEIEVPGEMGGPEIDGWLGDAVRAAQALKSLTESELRWSLEARLKIPWRRDLKRSVELSVEDGPAPRPKKRSIDKRPRPKAIAVAEWRSALDLGLKELVGAGAEIVKCEIRGPVDFAVVAPVVGEHPDLDPQLLTFYGLGDGVDIEVEQGGETRILEIPRFARLFDDSEDFSHRDGANVIFGPITIHEGAYYGLVRAEEIRRWRRQPQGVPGRPGYWDSSAETYQAALDRADSSRAWWVVRGVDHGADLREREPRLLTWEEMLGECLDHLLKGEA